MLRYLLLFWCLFWLLSSCGKSALKKEDLTGTWEIISASRNNKPTETLNGAFIQLDADTLWTNLLGDDEYGSYHFHKQVITSIRPAGDSLILKIIKLENDQLFLQTEIQNFVFDLELLKKANLIQH